MAWIPLLIPPSKGSSGGGPPTLGEFLKGLLIYFAAVSIVTFTSLVVSGIIVLVVYGVHKLLGIW